ncbi:MAG TPA: DUF2062 domain-containing protein [Terracidiphilus sp.]
MNFYSINWLKRKSAEWLRQSISPQRLALTLALGVAVGCLPVIGVPTLICAALAVALRLNLPAIQAANYAVMPLQLLLIVPFVRLGGRLFGSGRAKAAGSMLHAPWMGLLTQAGGLAGQALLAWLLIAIPAVALLTFMLTALLRRVSSVNAAGN